MSPSGSQFALALLLASCAMASQPVHALNAAVRDGMPCVEEVCVGDDILSLRHIAWLEVRHPSTGASLVGSRVTPAYLEQLSSILRAPDVVLESVAPYWYLRRFDAAGLAALEKVRAVCQSTGVSGRLQASYAHDENNETVVSFEPLPSQDGAPARFVVVAIRRYWNRVTDHATLARIGAELRQRYRGLSAYASQADPAAEWVPASGRGPHLKLLAPVGDPVELSAALRDQPTCRDH
jgi:hypothetical protein